MADTVDTLLYTRPYSATKKIYRGPQPALNLEQESLHQRGKVVVITGASAGIGKVRIPQYRPLSLTNQCQATAKVYARAHTTGIVLVARNEAKLSATVEEVRALADDDATVLGIPADVSRETDVRNVFARIATAFPNHKAPTVLINNAGTLPPGAKLGAGDPTTWWSGFETNVKGTALFTHYFLAAQPDATQLSGITVVNLGSFIADSVNDFGFSSYSLSKLACQRLTEFLHAEHGAAGLRSFCLVPGLVSEGNLLDAFKPYAKDDAQLVGLWSLYLQTSRADYLRGALISVNWDIEELEAHRREIEEGRLFHLGYLNAKLGDGGLWKE